MCWETVVLLGDAIDLSFTAVDKEDMEDSVVNDTFPALQHKESNASTTAVLQGSPSSNLPHCWLWPTRSGGNAFLEGSYLKLVSSPLWAVE